VNVDGSFAKGEIYHIIQRNKNTKFQQLPRAAGVQSSAQKPVLSCGAKENVMRNHYKLYQIEE